MNCWHCNTELIWGGDHDIKSWSPNEDEPAEEFDMVSNLTCPNCQSYVEVYHKFSSIEVDFEELEEQARSIRKKLDVYEQHKQIDWNRNALGYGAEETKKG